MIRLNLRVMSILGQSYPLPCYLRAMGLFVSVARTMYVYYVCRDFTEVLADFSVLPCKYICQPTVKVDRNRYYEG
jgi:hypothetical protein